MRTLALTLYLIIMGGLSIAWFFADYWEAEYYANEITQEYLDYSKFIKNLIQQDYKDLADEPGKSGNINFAELLPKWQTLLTDEIVAVELITQPKSADNRRHREPYIENMQLTEQADIVTVIQPLTLSNFSASTTQSLALRFTFNDAYSDEYMSYYYHSNLAVYLFMGLVITALAYFIYRYINNISLVTHAVAQGRFDLQMAGSGFAPLQKLADDINSMTNTIEEKTHENLILTSAIHHELRIPLTRLRLALDIMLLNTQDESIRNPLLDMDADLEELTHLTEDILTISRLKLSSQDIPVAEIALDKMLSSITEDLGDPRVHLNLLQPCLVKGNPTLIQRAIINVLGNATKYAENQIQISLRQDASGIRLEIADDGPGIPIEERQLVLKPFYRIDKSRNRQTGGFGLGLAIADIVIKNSGGQIQISDSHLGGTAVTIWWRRINE